MIDAFDPPGVWVPFGAFSMGVVQGAGRIVHLKGQVALDEAGRIVGKGDMRAQTRQVLDHIRTVLAAVQPELLRKLPRCSEREHGRDPIEYESARLAQTFTEDAV